MSDISPVGSGSTPPITGGGYSAPVSRASLNGSHNHQNGLAPSTAATPSQRLSDSVELSDRARLLESLRSLPPVRDEVVQMARLAVADGNYPSDEQLELAIERMLAEIEE